MPGNQYSREDWARLRWAEHRIEQLIETWRGKAAALRSQSQPVGGDALASRASCAAHTLDECAGDVAAILTASRLPGGPPLDAAYMARQVITWTRALERLAGTVDADITGQGTPAGPGFGQYTDGTMVRPIPPAGQAAAAGRYMAGKLAPGMVQVSAEDLRAALEDWGYEGPAGPKGDLDGDLPVFRLTRAAYGDLPEEPPHG